MASILDPVVILPIAFLLDLIIGDPHWFPHPVRIMGAATNALERLIRPLLTNPFHERLGGLLLTSIILLTTYVATYLLQAWLFSVSHSIISFVLLLFLSSSTIATKGLISSVKKVFEAVKKDNLRQARKKLSMIVGRETHNLDEKAVMTAALESLAENLSDGVIGPIFYYALGGLPLAMTYKAVNTLDSMLGYKNEKYMYFGWASARIDDLANYLPARITGLLIVISTFFMSLIYERNQVTASIRRSFSIMLKDGKNHTSPNSGIPEAAMSGAIGVRMGGASIYNGVVIQKPYIGVQRANGLDGHLKTLPKALLITRISSFLALLFATLTLFLFMRYSS